MQLTAVTFPLLYFFSMKKFIKQKPQDEQAIDILKRLAKRIEEATVDIHTMKTDLKFLKFKIDSIEHNTNIMKVDIEKLAEIPTPI